MEARADVCVVLMRVAPLLRHQGLEIVFRVGLAILQMNQAELIQLDMEGMLQVHRRPFCHFGLILSCYHEYLIVFIIYGPVLWFFESFPTLCRCVVSRAALSEGHSSPAGQRP